MTDVVDRVRRLLFGDDAARALAAERDRMRDALTPASPAGFADAQSRAEKASNAIRLGRLVESGEPLWAALDDLLVHMLVLGASGSGKSFLLLVLAVVAWMHGVPIIVIDPKGEMAELLLERILPTLISQLPASAQAHALSTIRVIDPFGSTALPPMNPLVREPALSIDLQALDVASCFEAVVDAGTGVRMQTVLDWLLRLVIAVGQGSFLTVRRALQDTAVLEALVRQCTDRETVSYFLTRWTTEPQSAKNAVLARLDRLLALPATRLSLSATTALDFDAMLTTGITIVNLGNVPAGLTDVADFWSTWVFTKLVRAIYRRPATGIGVPPAILLSDEWQSSVTRPLISSMEDVLARARSRRVFLWLCCQQRAQVERVSGALWDIVAGQTTIQVLFRATIDDARAMRHVLPVTGRMPRLAPAPWDRSRAASPFLSPAEEREARVEEIAHLANRTAYLWDRRRPWPAVQFRTATLDLPDGKRAPPAIALQVGRGSVAVDVADLRRLMDAEAARLDQLARHGARRAPSTTSARTGAAPTPTPAPRRKKRKGPGGVPW